MRKDRDYYEAGSTFAGLIGSSIIFIFFFLVVRFLLRVLGAAIEKIGLLSALCAGICIYHGVILLDRVLTPILHSSSTDGLGEFVQMFWQYLNLQRGTMALEYVCLGFAFALFFGITHRVFEFWFL